MRKLSVLFVLSSCLCATVNTNAVDWVPLAESNNANVQVYLDVDSVKPYTKEIILDNSDSSYMSGFAHFAYLEDHEYRKKGWYYMQYYFIVNCDDNSYYTPVFNAYDAQDRVVDSHRTKYFTANDFNIAFPNSLGNFVIHDICLFSP